MVFLQIYKYIRKKYISQDTWNKIYLSDESD